MVYPLAFYIAVCQYVYMVCIYCGQKTSTAITRSSNSSPRTWRRHKCSSCKAVFTTRELPDYALSIAVQHRNGQISPFMADKVFVSVFKSMTHRKDPTCDSRGITDTVIDRICNQQDNGIIKKESLRRVIADILQRFDDVAYVSYVAHHKD